MKTKYVVGFLFTGDMGHVILIRKQKPEWQRGQLNGIGGKIEANETPMLAMIREFKEETGTRVDEWREFCVMEGPDWHVTCFMATNSEAFALAETTEEEIIAQVPLRYLHEERCVPNLRWLIPMAIDSGAPVAQVQYSSSSKF